MQPLCTADEPCLYFFPDMGFRPAVHVVERDQYGDRLTLVVGDDGPLEGKVPPGYDIYALPVDPYAVPGNPAGPVMAALSQGSSGGVAPGLPVAFFGGGSSGNGSSGGGQTVYPPILPPIDDTSSIPPEGSTPTIPAKPPVPAPVVPTKPAVPITEIPTNPELPPLTPVPLPDAAPMLIAALLAFALLRRVKG